jgi:sugar (pentulose or hexulose) kinase
VTGGGSRQPAVDEPAAHLFEDARARQLRRQRVEEDATVRAGDDGPFAANAAFRAMLAAATGRPVVADAAGATGTSAGAALLALPDTAVWQAAAVSPPAPESPTLTAYATKWRALTTNGS